MDYNNVDIESIPAHGRFGAVRKHDVHTGVDLYCTNMETVQAYEDGFVVGISPFTGKEAGSPWWNSTYAVLIEGASGVILYGELGLPIVEVGDMIWKEDYLGFVKRVLKVDKGLPMTMLHIELYEHGYRGEGEWWKHGEQQPEMLLNVETLFNN